MRNIGKRAVILLVGMGVIALLVTFVGVNAYKWGHYQAMSDAFIATQSEMIGEYWIIWEKFQEGPDQLTGWLEDIVEMKLNSARSLRPHVADPEVRADLERKIIIAERLLQRVRENALAKTQPIE